MAYGLGIDGGGSATRWALCDAAGGIRAAGELGPVSGLLAQPDQRARMAAMAASLSAALDAAALGGVRPSRVVAGITGLSAAAPEAAEVAAILAAACRIDAADVRVADDVWIAYHAAFRPGEGHVVYAGTGSVGMHVRADGTVIQLGGRGALIDDAGAAFGIGRAALRLIYRRLDDDPDWTSALAEQVYAAIGGRSWEAVRGHVYADGRGRVAMLARAVAQAAGAGDADALAILRHAGADWGAWRGRSCVAKARGRWPCWVARRGCTRRSWRRCATRPPASRWPCARWTRRRRRRDWRAAREAATTLPGRLAPIAATPDQPLDPPRQQLESHEQHGDEHDTDEGREHHAAKHRGADRPPRAGAGAGGDGQRNDADDEGDRGHQHRAIARGGARLGRLAHRVAACQPVLGEFHDQMRSSPPARSAAPARPARHVQRQAAPHSASSAPRAATETDRITDSGSASFVRATRNR